MRLFDDKSLLSALTASLIVLAIGLFYFISQWIYSEPGHSVLVMTYCVLSICMLFTVRMRRVTLTSLIIILLVATISYAHLKFDWRKDYVLASQQGNFFPLEPYIDSYPTFEDQIFADMTGAPQWVEFSDTCFLPALRGGGVPRSCQSASMIEQYYNIDVNGLINRQYAKMRYTADQIEKGRIKDKQQFQKCFADKRCAMIPLLPADVDAETINQQSNDYLALRKMFWSLIENHKISPEICEFMELCRAMRNAGIMAIDKPI